MSSRRPKDLPVLPAERLLWEKLHNPSVAGLLFLFILGGFAVAGLWPFRQIHNDVAWIANQPGIHFGKHGIVLSDGALPADDTGACTVEMWVRPSAGEDSGTLLAFYGPSGGTGISLQRSLTDLRLDRESGGGRSIRFYVNEALPEGKLVFLTAVFGPRGTSVYLDGVLARKIPKLSAAPGDCSGSFGVGHPARGHTSWQGNIQGLAVYRHELTPEQVQTSYQSWRAAGHPDEGNTGEPAVLYLFDEKGGNVVRDHGAAGISLTVPDRYRDVHRTWLQSPHVAFESHWGYVEDIVVNIGGFAPFGFVLVSLLSSTGRVRRAGMWAVLGGLLVSLIIESLQAYLPTRNSDLTDVLTNTLGTCLGVGIYLAWQRRLTDAKTRG